MVWQSPKIYTSLQDRHADGRWTDFPDPPVENVVWDWLSGIQDEFLTKACCTYYTTSTKADLTGAESERQFDLSSSRKRTKVQFMIGKTCESLENTECPITNGKKSSSSLVGM